MSTGRPVSRTELKAALARVPRFALGHLPTPLEPLPRLSEKLGGPTIWIKRDDCTGFVFGGNKTRHNEYLLGDALASGADCFVWGAGVQSNNCRQTAAACAKAGLPIHLILSRAHSSGPVEPQGNLLLDYLVGASVEFTDAPVGPELDALIKAHADRLREAGRRPYFWNRPVVTAVAAIGYVPCILEIVEQTTAQGVDPSAIYLSSAGSTGAGAALGATALGLKAPVLSIAPMSWPWDTATEMAQIASEAARRLGLPHRLTAADLHVTNDYIPPAYGMPGPDCLEAMELIARAEAILLDPIYTGKALAGLIDHIRQGRYRTDEHVVFIHTGGTPVLFAMNQLLAESFPRAKPLSP